MARTLTAALAALSSLLLAAPAAHADSISLSGPMSASNGSAIFTVTYTCDPAQSDNPEFVPQQITAEVQKLDSSTIGVAYAPITCTGAPALQTLMTSSFFSNTGDQVRYKVTLPGGSTASGETALA